MRRARSITLLLLLFHAAAAAGEVVESIEREPAICATQQCGAPGAAL